MASSDACYLRQEESATASASTPTPMEIGVRSALVMAAAFALVLVHGRPVAWLRCRCRRRLQRPHDANSAEAPAHGERAEAKRSQGLNPEERRPVPSRRSFARAATAPAGVICAEDTQQLGAWEHGRRRLGGSSTGRPRTRGPAPPKDSATEATMQRRAMSTAGSPSVDSPAGVEQSLKRRSAISLAKPTRESRKRQIKSNVDECCNLNFEDVDASQQMGLTYRVLVVMKSLDVVHSYWEDDLKCEEVAFQLLGLDESDMIHVRTATERASTLVEQNNYRGAYDALSCTRPLFGQEWRPSKSCSPCPKEQKQQVAEAEADKAAGGCAATVSLPSSVISSRKTTETANHHSQKHTDCFPTLLASRPLASVNEGKCHATQRDGLELDGSRLSHLKSDAKAVERPAKPWSIVKSNGQNVKAASPLHARFLADEPKKLATRLSAESPQVGRAAPVEHLQKRALEKAAARARGSRREGESSKFLCRFEVGLEEDSTFQVCRRLIGPGGANMKHIVSKAGDGTKIRIRGRGSKYLEGPEKKEATDPLMVCISATSKENGEVASSLVESLLETVHEDYEFFCKSRGMRVPELLVQRQMQSAE
eukprot:TRINITY_DN2594_c0_g1_i3.p1 TRINITY_DN2594_c0_g1~~TRINITY_DN2594_c0_g1_i3.p1  ORF type:complete len:665 (+),score=120.96 TRINITY_DN2594_c0_g1_i3:211-1995(+)